MSIDVSPDGQSLVFDLLGDIYTMPGSRRQSHAHHHRHRARHAAALQPRRAGALCSSPIAVAMTTSGWSTQRRYCSHQLTTGEDNIFTSPEWTPDGQYIVVSKATLISLDHLWLYHVKGGRGVELGTAPPGLRMFGAAFGAGSALHLVSRSGSGSWTYNAIFPHYQIGVYDRETGTRTTMSARYGSAFRPALSPDGKWLTYGIAPRSRDRAAHPRYRNRRRAVAGLSDSAR